MKKTVLQEIVETSVREWDEERLWRELWTCWLLADEALRSRYADDMKRKLRVIRNRLSYMECVNGVPNYRHRELWLALEFVWQRSKSDCNRQREVTVAAANAIQSRISSALQETREPWKVEEILAEMKPVHSVNAMASEIRWMETARAANHIRNEIRRLVAEDESLIPETVLARC